MAETEIDIPTETVERNILLTGRIMQFLIPEPAKFFIGSDSDLIVAATHWRCARRAGRRRRLGTVAASGATNRS